ncbi:hypothetical protein NDN08_000303 [Rhodosorus marinus]|uniref:C2H2-type domain-containing protein n=1 Tax=Rhodosorus marinus TaxID=101924 RepID=A0AAV8UMJ1_9RHOD|nr:hypothetical protein NDN08_000303 [Rhodosorus marinus]
MCSVADLVCPPDPAEESSSELAPSSAENETWGRGDDLIVEKAEVRFGGKSTPGVATSRVQRAGGDVMFSPDTVKAGVDADVIQSGTNPNHCPYCGVWFKRKYEARRHVASVHLRIKPYECKVCKRQFSRKSQIRDHILAMHEKPRQFSCDLCSAVFQSKYSTERHIKGVHLKIKRFTCEVCGSMHFQKSDLSKHMQTMHKGHVMSINALLQPQPEENKKSGT